MIPLITWQHLNVYSYKLKNNVCVISIFHIYEAKKKKNWLVKSYCGRWSKKLTSGPVSNSFQWRKHQQKNNLKSQYPIRSWL